MRVALLGTICILFIAPIVVCQAEWLVGQVDNRVRACQADTIETGVTENDHIGHTMAAGDWNGDGYDDLITGMIVRDTHEFVANSGVVWIYLNDKNGGFSRVVEIVDIPNTPDMAPPVTFLGDINGDGAEDIAIGGPGFGPPHAGHRDQQGNLIALVHASGEFNTGSVFIFLGDVTEVPLPAGAPPVTRSVQLANFTLNCPPGYFEPNKQPYFGFSLAAVGDINGDAFGDLLVGAPGVVFKPFIQAPFTEPGEAPESNTAAGRAFVYHGRDPMVAGTPFVLAEVLDAGKGSAATPPEPGDDNRFGWSVAGAGDVDGDGIRDIAVGAIEAEFRGTFNYNPHGDGFVQVYFGSSLGLLSVPHRIDPVRAGADPTLFGFALTGGVDLNDNGRADVLVGCPRYSVGSNKQGAVYAYSFDGLRNQSDTFSALQPVTPPDDPVPIDPQDPTVTDSFLDQSGEFGWSLTSLGQFDLDPLFPDATRKEFLVGAFVSTNVEPDPAPCLGGNKQGGPQTGRVYVLAVEGLADEPTVQAFYRGESDEVPASAPRTGRTRLGTSVVVGDFNNDGFPDSAMSASGYAFPDFSEVGRIYVFLNPLAPPSP